MAQRFQIDPSFAYGRSDPLTALQQLTPIYKSLADNVVSSSSKRAENAIYALVTSQVSQEFLDRLPLGISAPLREAARTCQLAPPPDWPLAAYEAIGRDDVAASASRPPDMLLSDGYGSVKDFLVRSIPNLPYLMLNPFARILLGLAERSMNLCLRPHPPVLVMSSRQSLALSLDSKTSLIFDLVRIGD